MPWTLFETALGTCGLAWSDEGITSFQLPEDSRKSTKEQLLAKLPVPEPPAAARVTPDWVAHAIALVREHLAGRPQDFSSTLLDLSRVTPFNAKVYHALRKVPAGATVTYGELAYAVGSAGAARAVGRAMATNPIPVLVPCHRVLAARGKPGGFSAYGGIVTKERILGIEGWKTPALLVMPATELPYDRVAALRHLTATDSVLGAHLASIGDFTLNLRETESTFAALAQSIVYQQLNGRAAATILGRVQALFPKGRLDAKALLGLPEDDLRKAGLSRSKLASMRDLAERAAAGSIPTLTQLHRMTDDAIVEKLTEVRGIGQWTVEMLLIFRLGRPDVLPVTDYGIKKGFARVFHRGKRRDELPTAAELLRRGERWRPFRSVASWYLWRAADAAE